MRKLRWICGKIIKDRMGNKRILKNVKVASTSDKLRETHLRLFGHVQGQQKRLYR